MGKEDIRLSKTLSFILRHHPHYYELELEDGGWVKLDMLIEALRSENKRFAEITLADIERIITTSDKKRYEIDGGRIRAMYGHTVATALAYTPTEPPTILYHGTSTQFVGIIQQQGLKPMSRRYVHLSVEKETARLVGQRKSGKVVLLHITAMQAHVAGVKFYYGNDDVWLADHIPPEYIAVSPS